jgi:hypothetical protein
MPLKPYEAQGKRVFLPIHAANQHHRVLTLAPVKVLSVRQMNQVAFTESITTVNSFESGNTAASATYLDDLVRNHSVHCVFGL